MINSKFRFNPETLTYEKIELSLKERLIRFLFPLLPLSILVGFLFAIVFYYTFATTENKTAIRENNHLVEQYKKLDGQVDTLQKVLSEIQHRDDYIYRSLFQVEPVPPTVRGAGFGGTNRYQNLGGFIHSDMVIKTHQRIDQLTKQLAVQSNSFIEILNLAKSKEEELKCIPALMPVSKKHSHFSSFFGMRMHPLLGRRRMHAGIDFSAAVGTAIHAPGNGRVVETARSGGYGLQITIDHGFGYVTRYAHLKTIKVKRGQEVKRGDVIAQVGNSGLSTGPHLHYEVHKDGKHINPINFFFQDLNPEEYCVLNHDHDHAEHGKK